MTDKQLIDNTPHPKILRVLGEIKFLPWQCIAEFIDNAIDGFLEMTRHGHPITDPVIQVAFGRDTVKIKDNGPGMSFDQLEGAVRAGWSSQQELDSLGLYGMGFNIATAVLGSVTTIWTTRAGDPEWHGTEIDLHKLAASGSFGVPRRRREKSDPKMSGTEVEITGLKTEHRENLTNANWVRTHITERLRRVYSTMLRERSPQPLGFTLLLNQRRVLAQEHCTWPADWTVYRKSEGDVAPFREIDVDFGTRYRNRNTGETFDTPDGIPSEDLVEIPQRVYGWIGIQRYVDEKEYGFDLIRNGRKIETDCKDFFSWDDDEGNDTLEYPIDEVRLRRGRIVGELHLDHGYVYYTKDRFERNHVSWEHLDRAVRGKEPLTKRAEFGFPNPVNESPLGVLFRTFRRNSPYKQSGQTWWDILCFEENAVAKQWAEEWRKGNREYRDNEKWRGKLKGYDAPPPNVDTPGDNDADDDAGDDLILSRGNGGIPAPGGTEPGGEITGSSITTAQPPVAQRITDLTLHITGIGIRGSTYDVEALAIESAQPGANDSPWRTQPTARGVYEVYVNTNHPAFDSTTLQVRDAVLTEMAHIITNEEEAQSSTADSISFADVLVSLRDKYSGTDSLDISQLTKDIEDIRKYLTGRLSRHLDGSAQGNLIERLATQEMRTVQLAAAQGLVGTPITDYLSIGGIAFLIEAYPEGLFRADCFNRAWTPNNIAENESLLELHRTNLVRALTSLLVTLSDFGVTVGAGATRDYLSYVRASINRLREFLQ